MSRAIVFVDQVICCYVLVVGALFVSCLLSNMFHESLISRAELTGTVLSFCLGKIIVTNYGRRINSVIQLTVILNFDGLGSYE